MKRVGQYFGELQIHALQGLPDHPEVRKLQADGNSKHVAGEEWHTDMSCATIPPGLTATHDGKLAFGRFNPDGKFPVAVHPVIRTHPVTGRKVLFVNKGFTARINEVPDAESAAILQFLFHHCENAYFQVRFRWEPHSVAFWDNRCTQHLAIWDYFPQLRSGFRVQIADKGGPKESA